jgi:CBS domain containing-hemolysin-like protein
MMIFPIVIHAAGGISVATEASLTGLFFYVMLALCVSFLCSVLEAVLLSTSVSYVELKVEQGSRAGKLMRKHKENVERPIIAILTLNTIAHTLGAAGAGAQAAAIFGSQYIGVISAVLTLLILVFSEIIPKTFGAVYWKQLNPFSAYVIRGLVIVLYPVVRVFELMTRMLRPETEEPTVTRLELEVMTNIGLQEGALIERENRIVRNLLQLHNVAVETIMTPRTVLMAIDKNLTVQEVLEKYPSIPYSRIPLYGENIDHINGYALRHEILERMAADEHLVRLEELCHEMHAVPETSSVGQVMDEFITRKEQAFLVVDEFGGTAGIVTLEDVIESLLGIEITDETDVVADLRQLAQQRYLRKRADQVAAEQTAVKGIAQPTRPAEDFPL